MVNSSFKKNGGNKHQGYHYFNLMVGGAGSGSNGKGKGKGVGKGVGDAFLKLLNEKKEFLLMVFSNLIVQLGITYYVMMNYDSLMGSNSNAKKNDGKINAGLLIGLFLVQIGIIFLLTMNSGFMPIWVKFLLFSLFSAIFGVFTYFLQKHVDLKVIQMAILGTLSIFGAMFLFGAFLLMSGIKLGIRFAASLFYLLLLLILLYIVTSLTGHNSSLMKVLYIFGLLLFSTYIVYDTNNILQRNYYGDFISASLDYYLDIINIFKDLVMINNN
jgi:FtsH-binding integral membrane protein